MNRRQFLRIAGAVAGSGLAGCLASDRFAAFGNTRPNLDAAGADWATFGADRANTGYAPDASGPPSDAGIVWQFEAGSSAGDTSGNPTADASENPTADASDDPTGHTSPVVVGDAVFTGGPGTDATLYALDAESGDRYWEFDTRGRVVHAPAVADDAVYVGTDDRRVHAVDARTGDERWTTTLRRDIRHSSPTVFDDTVYVGTAGDSPATASDDERDQRAGGALVALDAETGGGCWSFLTADRISTTPAVVGERVYFGDDAGRVHALDAATGERAWSFAAGSRVASSPAVDDGVCYFGARGLLFALDAATGEPYWTFDLELPTVAGSPAVADGTVYVGCHGTDGCVSSPDGDACEPPESAARLCAVDADHGAQRWTYDLTGDVRSSPAVADGAVYLGGADGVSAVDAGDGAEVWRAEFGESVDSSPAVSDGRVFVTRSDGSLYALGETE